MYNSGSGGRSGSASKYHLIFLNTWHKNIVIWKHFLFCCRFFFFPFAEYDWHFVCMRSVYYYDIVLNWIDWIDCVFACACVDRVALVFASPLLIFSFLFVIVINASPIKIDILIAFGSLRQLCYNSIWIWIVIFFVFKYIYAYVCVLHCCYTCARVNACAWVRAYSTTESSEFC